MIHREVNNTPAYLSCLNRFNDKGKTVLFIHLHALIIVYNVFPLKCVQIHSLRDYLCMLLRHSRMPLILLIEYCLLILIVYHNVT